MPHKMDCEKNNICIWFFVFMLIISTAFFLSGKSLLIKDTPQVTGLVFLQNEPKGNADSYQYRQNETIQLEIISIRNFKLDKDGYAWIDASLLLKETDTGKVIIDSKNLFGESGKTMMLSTDGINTKLNLSLENIEPGKYLLEISVLDRNDNSRIIRTFAETITIQ